jgi:hypothetical protein
MMEKPGNSSRRVQKFIALCYEHPDCYKPLFAELDTRSVRWHKIHACQHLYGIHDKTPAYSLVFNRMSLSAWQGGSGALRS